jgi:hypothetical protein
MSADHPDHPADSERPGEGGFAEGQADPEAFPEDAEVGRFSEGQEELGEDDPEKYHMGRFSEGQEDLGDDDPEKHVQGQFSDEEDAG